MPRTLLVIDDNEAVRETLVFLLSRRGYHVLAAEDGVEALRLADEQEIDGAMVDVNMPGMSGSEVCRALRKAAAAKGRDLAVWLMSGARTPEAVKESQEAGAVGLVGKPFDLASLYRQFETRFTAAPAGAPPKPAPGS